MTNSRRLKRSNIVNFQQPVQIQCVFYFSSVGESLIWGHSSGLDPATYLSRWHSGGGGKGKVVTLDSSVAGPQRWPVRNSSCSIHIQLHITQNPRRKLQRYSTSSKSKIRENVGLLMNQLGVLVMESMQKLELLNAAFASAFPADVRSPRPRDKKSGERKAPLGHGGLD